jgi:predicted transcriptional regulator
MDRAVHTSALRPARPPRARTRQTKEIRVRVKDLMSQPVYACQIDQPLQAAAQLMWEHDCGIVPVVDGDGRLAGVITDRDICMAALFQHHRLSEIAVSKVMATDVATCRQGDQLIDAEHLMSLRQVHRLPVVDEDGAPIGMLSLSDVARRVRQASGKNNGAADLAETIAAICEPHPVAIVGN